MSQDSPERQAMRTVLADLETPELRRALRIEVFQAPLALRRWLLRWACLAILLLALAVAIIERVVGRYTTGWALSYGALCYLGGVLTSTVLWGVRGPEESCPPAQPRG